MNVKSYEERHLFVILARDLQVKRAGARHGNPGNKLEKERKQS